MLELIVKKAALVSQYREVARWRAPEWLNDPTLNIEAKRKSELERLNKLVIAASADINVAAEPKPHHFEIAPAK